MALMTRRSYTLQLAPTTPRRIDPMLTVGQDVILLGSTVRGVLRHVALRLAEARGAPCTAQPECDCPPCRLFGGPDRPGRIAVRSSVAPGWFRDTTSVAIDRRRRTADRQGRRLSSALTAIADHRISVTATDLEPRDEQFLDVLFGWIQLVGLQLGQKRSAGFGWTTVTVETTGTSSSVRAGPGAKSHAPRSANDRERRCLWLTALEPIRLSSRVQRDFYRDSDRTVPPNTLRGALGWALVEHHGDDVARWLMTDEPIGIGPGWLRDPSDGDDVTDPTRWLGRYRCRGSNGGVHHDVDLAAAQIRAALRDEPVKLICPRCDASVKPSRGASPSYVVLGQTEIDRHRNRAAEHQLRFQATVSPGTQFAALVEATPQQFELLASLETVFVGGNRRRGLGATEIKLSPPLNSGQTFAPVDLEGVEVVVAGLATDGFAPVALRQRFENEGLSVVAANVRTVERGGWDTLQNQMRPVRRLLQAGSWFALRSADVDAAIDTERFAAAAAELFDPTDTDPIWMVPRPLEAP